MAARQLVTSRVRIRRQYTPDRERTVHMRTIYFIKHAHGNDESRLS
jgi:hypothetical protein